MVPGENRIMCTIHDDFPFLKLQAYSRQAYKSNTPCFIMKCVNFHQQWFRNLYIDLLFYHSLESQMAQFSPVPLPVECLTMTPRSFRVPILKHDGEGAKSSGHSLKKQYSHLTLLTSYFRPPGTALSQKEQPTGWNQGIGCTNGLGPPSLLLFLQRRGSLVCSRMSKQLDDNIQAQI